MGGMVWKAVRDMMPISAPQIKHSLGRKGFSLLEILLCLLLLGILATGFARIFQGSLAIGQIQHAEHEEIAGRRLAVRHQFAGLADAERVIVLVEED